MNDQEREVINDIFRRLEQVANQPRDPEAEQLIADKLRQQPYAPYAMAQAVYVQEQALASLQAENDRLRAELDQAHQQPQQGGFLSSIFGGGSRPPGPAYNAPPARQASPWGGSSPTGHPVRQPHGGPQSHMMGGKPSPWGGGMMQSRGGGGFLQTALSTAAGVAGGMMIANALTNAFGGDAQNAAGEQANLADQASAAEPAGAVGDQASITDSLYQDPQDGEDDFSDFGGDGGDWA